MTYRAEAAHRVATPMAFATLRCRQAVRPARPGVVHHAESRADRIVRWLLAAVVLVTGCASPTPELVRTPIPGAPEIQRVRQDIAAFAGSRVRWGGTIAAVENQPNESLVEVVARPLERDGRPRVTDATGGRFLARVAGFLDPAIYSEGRQFTVTGVVDGAVSRPIGEYPYQYPVVRAEAHYLWEPEPVLPPYPYPYYYGPPWYDPWCPFGWPRWGPYCW